MDLIKQILDIFLHLDDHLVAVTQQYGAWVYLLLFAVVFVETGLVIMPFLPGDSLLFVVGALVAAGDMDPFAVTATLIGAALCGDNTNYLIGRTVGPRLFRHENSRFLRKQNLERTHAFLEKHGQKAIVLARFVPIVRTFMPFVCGLGHMPYPRFLAWSVMGAVLWVGLLVPAGYFFGNIPVVRDNLTVVILLIVFLSVLPGIIEFVKARRAA